MRKCQCANTELRNSESISSSSNEYIMVSLKHYEVNFTVKSEINQLIVRKHYLILKRTTPIHDNILSFKKMVIVEKTS